MTAKGLKPTILEPDSVLGVQPVLNSDDDQSPPECLLSLQPVEDDYSSDDEARKKEKKSKPSRKQSHSYHTTALPNALNLTEQFIAHSIRPSYVPHDPGCDFTENPTLAQCLQELLDFALEENQERRTLSDGKILFDGNTADEIIEFWSLTCPKVKWLREHFSHDLVNGHFKVNDYVKDKPNQTVRSIEERKVFAVEIQCLDFISHFLELFQTGDKYDTGLIDSCSPSDLHDLFKQVVPLIASFLDISHRSGGECRVKMEISKVRDSVETFGFAREDRVVTTQPEYILTTREGSISVPVQVYAPIGEVNDSGADVTHPQMSRRIQLNTQHTLQHIGILRDKMADLLDYRNQAHAARDKPCVSVGMLLTRGIVHLSKVTTTITHLSSFMKLFLPIKVQIEGSQSENLITQEMLNNVRENGLVVTRSKWHVDLCKGLHRNALFLFLLQYIWGHVYFVQNNVVM